MKTFSDIYEAMRTEKYSEKIQALPKNFLREVSEYLKEKREFLDKEEDMFSDMALKNKKKFENAHASFRDLIRIRKKKILNLAFVASEVGINKQDFEHLLSYEKDLFEELVRGLERSEQHLTEEMNGGTNEEGKHRLVRFTEEVPEFLNYDGTTIGPFKKGEIAHIEKEIVEILEQDKRIEVLEED